MGDSQTDRQAGASHAALMAELSSLRDLLAKRDNRLAEQDERLAELTGLIRDLRDEIRLLKNLPRRPELKPSGLAASGASGADRSKMQGKGRKKGRSPRRRNPKLHRRDERVALEDVPEGAERRGYQAHTVRDIVFHAEEVTPASRRGPAAALCRCR